MTRFPNSMNYFSYKESVVGLSKKVMENYNVVERDGGLGLVPKDEINGVNMDDLRPPKADAKGGGSGCGINEWLPPYRERWAERLRKRRALLGRQGCTDSHFGELYIVDFDDGTFVDVYFWTEHGVSEKDQHGKAEEIARTHFPNLNIKYVTYA